MADVLPAHSQASGPVPAESEVKSDKQIPVTSNGKPKVAPNATKEENSSIVQNGKSLPNGVKGKEQASGEKIVEKLSGAELKKRKQAEKAARRAQEKESKQQADDGKSKTADKPESKQETKAKSSKKTTPSTSTAPQVSAIEHPQHHRKGSIQKTPHPKAPLLTESPSPEPPKHDRRVALFGHLYGKEARRSTIAGANKDVDPAVLALGLQMSNYVICGSNARCVALLLVLKRVRPLSPTKCSQPVVSKLLSRSYHPTPHLLALPSPATSHSISQPKSITLFPAVLCP